jgi:hypothetical protein
MYIAKHIGKLMNPSHSSGTRADLAGPSSIHSRTPTLNDPSPDSYNPYFNSPKPPSLPKISKTTRKHKLDATDTDNNELVKPKRKYTRRTPKVDT